MVGNYQEFMEVDHGLVVMLLRLMNLWNEMLRMWLTINLRLEYCIGWLNLEEWTS